MNVRHVQKLQRRSHQKEISPIGKAGKPRCVSVLHGDRHEKTHAQHLELAPVKRRVCAATADISADRLGPHHLIILYIHTHLATPGVLKLPPREAIISSRSQTLHRPQRAQDMTSTLIRGIYISVHMLECAERGSVHVHAYGIQPAVDPCTQPHSDRHSHCPLSSRGQPPAFRQCVRRLQQWHAVASFCSGKAMF